MLMMEASIWGITLCTSVLTFMFDIRVTYALRSELLAVQHHCILLRRSKYSDKFASHAWSQTSSHFEKVSCQFVCFQAIYLGHPQLTSIEWNGISHRNSPWICRSRSKSQLSTTMVSVWGVSAKIFELSMRFVSVYSIHFHNLNTSTCTLHTHFVRKLSFHRFTTSSRAPFRWR